MSKYKKNDDGLYVMKQEESAKYETRKQLKKKYDGKVITKLSNTEKDDILMLLAKLHGVDISS